VAEQYITGLIHESRGEADDYKIAVTYYNRLLSETRKKFDHRHPFICSLLERRGAVLFEQRKLQCSMLSYLACLKILEHQQFTNNIAFHEEVMARILYAVARVLHDKEDYHDALHMYQRALVCQRSLAADKPSLNVITTLCNISRVHHLCGEIDEALATNKEVLKLATDLVGGKFDHPFLIHRLKVEGNILIEAGRLEDAMSTFIDAARRCCEDGRNRMITTLMGSNSGGGNAQEDADAGDSSVLSMRSSAALAHISFLHPAAPAG
jgi:tetratricopeptide (TPR) repeat protein